MKTCNVKILETFFVTHNVKSFIVERPENYNFKPGQATEVAMHKEGWKDKGRPFTFTSLPEDKYLQFVIKTYPSHDGVTKEMLKLDVGDELILHDVFGAITYQGKGSFIAGGAGITPFIAIFRKLQKDGGLIGNKLIFANKTHDDIILEKEFAGMLGKNFVNILSDEKVEGFQHGTLNKDFLEKHMGGHTGKFYVCGPQAMNDDIVKHLTDLGIPESSIILEEM